MRKDISLEFMRIIACCLVVINHCSSDLLFYLAPPSIAWFVEVGMFYVTKVAVQIFLMISGYNLLHKQDDYHKSMKRFAKVFSALMVFSLLYEITRDIIGGTAFSISGFLVTVYKGPITDAFWYLYMYLGILLMLPFIQKFARSMEQKDFPIFFLLALIADCIWPTIGAFYPGVLWAEDFKLPILLTCVVYLMLGDYFYRYGDALVQKLGKLGNVGAIITYACMLIVNIGISYMEYRNSSGEHFLSLGEINYLPLAAESICVFYLVRQIKFSTKWERVILMFSANTFGIYLLSDFLAGRTHLIYYYGSIYMNRLIAVGIQILVALILGNVIVFLLRKIPFFNKIV